MIKIPFERCVILTTLDFEQISDRLAIAIYDPYYRVSQAAKKLPRCQSYSGEIWGFKFLAQRIIGHKYFHLPLFLSPIIEGKIASLAHGYEIAIAVKLRNITFMLLLTWLGGLLTASSVAFEKIFTNIQDDRYTISIGISALLYVMTIAYFYVASWHAIGFFKDLFTQRLTGISRIKVAQQQKWTPDLQRSAAQRSTSE